MNIYRSTLYMDQISQ